MKTILSAVAVLISLGLSSLAEEANGLRVTAQKTLLEKNKDRDNSAYWDTVDKAIGLKVNARNVSLADMPEGTVDYIVIVKRWGYSPDKLESFTGSEKLPALVKSAEANLTVGKVAIGGYEAGGNRKQYQDTIEAWRIIVKHDGKETLKITSTSAFDKLLPKAKPGTPAKK